MHELCVSRTWSSYWVTKKFRRHIFKRDRGRTWAVEVRGCWRGSTFCQSPMIEHGQGQYPISEQGKYTRKLKGQARGQRPLPSHLLQSRRGRCGRQGAPSRSEFQGRLSPAVSGLPFQVHCASLKKAREIQIKQTLKSHKVKMHCRYRTFIEHRGPSRCCYQELQPLQLSLPSLPPCCCLHCP